MKPKKETVEQFGVVHQDGYVQTFNGNAYGAEQRCRELTEQYRKAHVDFQPRIVRRVLHIETRYNPGAWVQWP